MTSYKPGDIVLVPFPFADLSSHKQRPAFLLSYNAMPKTDGLLTLAMITSQIKTAKLSGDYFIQKWQEAGLLHPSKLRLAKMVSLEGSVIIKKLGSVSAQDKKQIANILKQQFSHWL